MTHFSRGTVALFVALALVACSSPSSSSSAEGQDSVATAAPQVDGLYQSSDGAGAIQWVAFQESNRYVLAHAPEGTVEQGTYALSDDRTTVTFTSATGQVATMSYAVVEAGDEQTALVHPQAFGAPIVDPGGAIADPGGPIVNPGGPIVHVATKLLVNANPVQLVAAGGCGMGGMAGFCKASVNPMSVNCAGGPGSGGCPPGLTCCYRYPGT